MTPDKAQVLVVVIWEAAVGTPVVVALSPVCLALAVPGFLDWQMPQTRPKAGKYRQSAPQYGRFSLVLSCYTSFRLAEAHQKPFVDTAQSALPDFMLR
ncbi:hypothetical protein [Dickeya sp. CFBP 2040]|uniref:hypothetical protein n=1 Tax=Dickeya sp. CFBP 2040 TaxID=2718531 RepID=UPI0014457226|nr:hypothetical protein [Dickeya sp. CFBP 2040]